MRCFSPTHGHRRARADPHAPERTETTHDNRTTEVKTLSRAHDRAGPANSVWSTKNVRVQLRFRLILVTFRRFFSETSFFLSLAIFSACLSFFLYLLFRPIARSLSPATNSRPSPYVVPLRLMVPLPAGAIGAQRHCAPSAAHRPSFALRESNSIEAHKMPPLWSGVPSLLHRTRNLWKYKTFHLPQNVRYIYYPCYVAVVPSGSHDTT